MNFAVAGAPHLPLLFFAFANPNPLFACGLFWVMLPTTSATLFPPQVVSGRCIGHVIVTLLLVFVLLPVTVNVPRLHIPLPVTRIATPSVINNSPARVAASIPRHVRHLLSLWVFSHTLTSIAGLGGCVKRGRAAKT